MTEGANREWRLHRRPVGEVLDGDLQFVTCDVPEAETGELVIRIELISMDPANRVWMNENPVYMPPIPLGEPMRGLILGEVTESRAEGFEPGDRVMGVGTWANYCVLPAGAVQKVPDLGDVNEADVFGIFYAHAPTAYFGVSDICALREGETMVVTGAAGIVGSIAGQIAKARGCRVVGVAGKDEKCRLIVDEYGMDAAVNYRAHSFEEDLKNSCKDGIDCLFDNVAGPVLDSVLGLMNEHGRVAQCGALALYNGSGEGQRLKNYMNVVVKRLTIQGFIIFDYASRYPEAYEALLGLYSSGNLKWRTQVETGLEKAPEVLAMLYRGENYGKLVLRI